MPIDIVADKRNPGLTPNPYEDPTNAPFEERKRKFITVGPSQDKTERPVDEAAAPSEPYVLINQNETDKNLDPNSPGFGTMVSHEIDNGLGSNLYGLLQDFGQAEPETDALFLELAETADQLTEKYGWDSTMLDELMSEVQSKEELERKAARIAEQQTYMASLENTSMAKQLAAGFTGFVLDPINLIPAGVVIKAGAATAKVFPRIASTLQKSALGKTTAFSTMGAVEEAVRNYPRLMNDPTYSYEMYKLDVAIGAGFGAGLAGIPIAGRFAKSKISKGVNEAVDKYTTSLNARLAINTLTDTLRVTKNPAAKKAVQDAIDATAGPEAVRAAKKAANVERAQTQVDAAKVNVKLKDISAKVSKAIEEGQLDAQSVIQEFSSELRRTHPTFAKIADAITERVKRATEDTQSVGAARRKETLRTKVQDAAVDTDSVMIKEALDDIDRAFD
ncbi:MAG: hypothetical protein GY799_19760, partial [Desulfobulbaceae bacterium]|nr:hypothetical protein [Desulfobulbaceae bacterium]